MGMKRQIKISQRAMREASIEYDRLLASRLRRNMEFEDSVIENTELPHNLRATVADRQIARFERARDRLGPPEVPITKVQIIGAPDQFVNRQTRDEDPKDDDDCLEEAQES